MKDKSPYRSLALFGSIIAELVLTPTLFGVCGYYFSKGHTHQDLIALGLGLVGLGVGLYRLSRIKKGLSNDEPGK